MSTPTEAPKEYDTAYAYRTLFLFAGLVITILYVEGMLTPSLPTIAAEFAVSPAQVSLVLALYSVSGTALNPIVGKLGDVYGKKKILTYVLLIYAAAVTVTGFSPTFEFMLASRTVQGIGLAIFPLVFSLVREEFPRDMVPKAQGIISGMFGVGFAVSLPLGALISNDFGWRTTYHTAVPFVLIGTGMIIWKVKESHYIRPNQKIDFIGAAILGASLVMFVLALAEGPSWGWTSFSTLGLLAGSLVILPPLFLFERWYSSKGTEAILNLRLLSIRNVLASNVLILVASLGMFLAFQAYVYKFELFSPIGFHLDIFNTGLSLFPLAVAFIIFAPLTGIIVSRTGIKRVAAVGAILSALGFYYTTWATTYYQYLGGMFVAGAGLSILQSSVINLLTLTVELRDMGLATSLNTVFRNLGASLGAPIAGSILSTYTAVVVVSQGGRTFPASLPTLAAFQYVFYLAVVVFVAMLVIIPLAREVLGKSAIMESTEMKPAEREARASQMTSNPTADRAP
ncbi:MAG: MFS transporter [Thaumarchaeota archaeon]|nr:MFS transporter [Nitrososphaerota archaeon]